MQPNFRSKVDKTDIKILTRYPQCVIIKQKGGMTVFFNSEYTDIDIFGVDHIKWGVDRCIVPARSYSALALRVYGDGVLSAGGSEVQTTAGNLLFVPQDVAYTATYSDTEIYVIHFVCGEGAFRAIENVALTNPDAVLPLFRRALSAWRSKQAGYRMEILALLLEILVIARRQTLDATGDSQAFKRAISILQTAYADATLSITEVCAQAGISDSYFRRQCKQHFSMSPVQYLTELRLTHAEHLLRSPSCSIEAAALQSGFSDPKYFARVVRRRRGCVPSELRFI